MKFNSDFRHDLEVGQLGEKALAEVLEKKTIEVKKDLQAMTTGNIFVEGKSRGKPSGIVTSEADYWAYMLDDDLFVLLSTARMKRLVRKNKHRLVRGGDSDTSSGVLISVKELVCKV